MLVSLAGVVKHGRETCITLRRKKRNLSPDKNGHAPLPLRIEIEQSICKPFLSELGEFHVLSFY